MASHFLLRALGFENKIKLSWYVTKKDYKDFWQVGAISSMKGCFYSQIPVVPRLRMQTASHLSSWHHRLPWPTPLLWFGKHSLLILCHLCCVSVHGQDTDWTMSSTWSFPVEKGLCGRTREQNIKREWKKRWNFITFLRASCNPLEKLPLAGCHTLSIPCRQGI